MNPKLPLITLILIVNSAAVLGQNCNINSSRAKAVRRIAESIIAADNARDITTVLSFYHEDAVLMPPNEVPVSGWAAIRPRYESLFATFQPRIEGRVNEVCVNQTLAFVRGHNGGELIPVKGGERRQLDDSYLMLLRRRHDGKWRISHLIWHRSH